MEPVVTVDRVPLARLDHLRRITGEYGLFEHAQGDEPRIAHGYTTDDNSRALVVLRRAFPDEVSTTGYRPYLDFVLAGAVGQGWHNRMSAIGEWTDLRGPDDCHGRAIWGLGEVLASGEAGVDDPELVQATFLASLTLASNHSRAVAYALLGVAAVLEAAVSDETIAAFAERQIDILAGTGSGQWPWPEPRLTYDNARIPEAMIRVGAVIGDEGLVTAGLELLGWLMETERGHRGFSFTPVGGRGPDGPKPAFDQQPLEAWAMADACLAAWRVDDDPVWKLGLRDAVHWFLGVNDTSALLYDEDTGAGFDGLEPDGVNLNRGAESTLAALGALAAHGAVSGRSVS